MRAILFTVVGTVLAAFAQAKEAASAATTSAVPVQTTTPAPAAPTSAAAEPLTVPYSGLAINSPFVPLNFKPQTTKVAGGKPSGKLELRGMVQMGNVWEFSLYDTQKRKGFWVVQNDPLASVHILDFSPEDKTVTVDSGTGAQTLSMKTPTLGAGLPAPKAVPGNTNAGSNGSNNKASKREQEAEELLALLDELDALDAMLANKPAKK